MNISTEFPGGNIAVSAIEGNTVRLERDLRDTEGDWFYWAFRVDGAAGKTLEFVFPNQYRVGWHGPAVSTDGKAWHWLFEDSAHNGDRFSYAFGKDENSVYFAHHMLYSPDRFFGFCSRHGLSVKDFAETAKGRKVPCTVLGNGAISMLATSRNHACESTGSYVLEGLCETLLGDPGFLSRYKVLVIPFMDYDGVVDGDQGKNRRPHDHNSDYTDRPIYDVVGRLMHFVKTHGIAYSLDFHSPWHIGERNDHVFISHSTESMEEAVLRFAPMLSAKTAGDDLPYERAFDCGPNEAWNNENNPLSKNWLSRIPGNRLAVTLETPYFGLDANRVSQEALITLGRHFGDAFLAFDASVTHMASRR